VGIAEALARGEVPAAISEHLVRETGIELT
jgi:hypothetical protein